MKKFYLIVAALTVIFSSCGGNGNKDPKEISPTSTDFTSGELARYIEVVNEPAQLTFSEQKGDFSTQHIRLAVPIKLVKEGFPNVDARDIELTGLFGYAGYIDLVDQNGAKLTDLKVSSSDNLKIQKLLTQPVGTIETIIFEDEYHNPDLTYFQDATGFTPSITANPSVKNMENNSQVIGDTNESSFGPENIILPSQLKGNVEVIDASKEVSSYGDPEVSITFKLLKKVNTAPLLSEYGQMWIVGVGQNNKGVDVKDLLPNYKEWRSRDRDGNEFKQFLEGEPDETITLEFTGSKDNSSNVSSDLNQVEKFKLKLTK